MNTFCDEQGFLMDQYLKLPKYITCSSTHVREDCNEIEDFENKHEVWANKKAK